MDTLNNVYYISDFYKLLSVYINTYILTPGWCVSGCHKKISFPANRESFLTFVKQKFIRSIILS